MSRTVTAMFDSRRDAEAGRERLLAAGIDATNVNILDQSSQGFSAGNDVNSYSGATTQSRGIWGSVKNAFLPDEDRHHYEEGIRRGSFVLTADVGEHEVDEAVRALENAEGGVDIDDRFNSYRESGFNYDRNSYGDDARFGSLSTNQAAAGGIGGAVGRMADKLTGDDDSSKTSLGTTRGTGTSGYAAASTDVSGEQSIPVIEERLVVGKREVNRGGVRVRSYVTERPVHEQVRLREEHVHVERRPVDGGRVDADGAMFQERDITLTETAEEAVVGKEARVVEEVVVGKTSEERTEDVSDTVRRTDVDVEQINSTTGTTGTTGTSGARTDRDRY